MEKGQKPGPQSGPLDQKTANLKGIRIRTVNMVMLALSLVLFIIVLYTTIQISREYTATIQATEKYIKWEKAAHDLHVGSDFLTEQARLYVQTKDPSHLKQYFSELYSKRSRDHALEEFASNSPDPTHKAALQKAFNLSNDLTHKEIYAMRLVAENNGNDLSLFPWKLMTIRPTEDDSQLPASEKLETARDMLFNQKYTNAKNNITTALSRVLDQNLAKTHLEQTTQTRKLGEVLMEQRVVLIALCLLNILTFMMIILLIVKPLKIYLKCIRDDKMLELVGAYEFKHLALTYNDIFAIKEHHDKMLRHKAEHDQLTGLLNRNAFEALLPLLEQNGEPVGFALIDVDKFKEVNDTWGHEVGDMALCRVAHLLQQHFRSNDFCIRLGGDEFAVVLNGMTPHMEDVVKEKITAINDELTHPLDTMPALSISVGVAFSNAGFSDNLYRDADSALYDVKKAGRRGCKFYHQKEDDK